jgi:hypothetical protein
MAHRRWRSAIQLRILGRAELLKTSLISGLRLQILPALNGACLEGSENRTERLCATPARSPQIPHKRATPRGIGGHLVACKSSEKTLKRGAGWDCKAVYTGSIPVVASECSASPGPSAVRRAQRLLQADERLPPRERLHDVSMAVDDEQRWQLREAIAEPYFARLVP